MVFKTHHDAAFFSSPVSKGSIPAHWTHAHHQHIYSRVTRSLPRHLLEGKMHRLVSDCTVIQY